MNTSTHATLDSVGRVLIPKRLRQHLGMAPGQEVTLAAQGGQLVLTPVLSQPVLACENGVWVAQGSATGDVPGELARMRNERLAKTGRAKP